MLAPFPNNPVPRMDRSLNQLCPTDQHIPANLTPVSTAFDLASDTRNISGEEFTVDNAFKFGNSKLGQADIPIGGCNSPQIGKQRPNKSCLKNNAQGRNMSNGRQSLRSRASSFDKSIFNLSGSLESSKMRKSSLPTYTSDGSISYSKHRKRTSEKSGGSSEITYEESTVRFDSVVVYPLCVNSLQYLPENIPSKIQVQSESCTVDEFEARRIPSKRLKDTRLTIAQRRFLLYRQGYNEQEIEEIIDKQREAQKRRKELLNQINRKEQHNLPKKTAWGRLLAPILPYTTGKRSAEGQKNEKRQSL